MRALIIDDERLAREELRELLKTHGEISIVGEAGNGPEGRRLTAELRPDLLFLDVQMPEEDGFAMLAALEPPVPRVIFVTAFDRYALQAFEVNALDYLVKPVDPDRLQRAIARLDPTGPSLAPDAGPETPLAETHRVFLREGDRCWFVAVRDFALLEADGNSTRVYFAKERPLLARSLASLEPRLPAEIFFRANRTQVVNVNAIENVEPWFSKSLRVRLRGGLEVEFSRRQAQLFRESRGL